MSCGGPGAHSGERLHRHRMCAHRSLGAALWGVLCIFLTFACAHGDKAAETGKKKSKRRHTAHGVQDANTPAAPQGPSDRTSEGVTEPHALAPNTWQVEADGSSLEEAARHAAHAAVVWCGRRKQVPLPQSDSNQSTATGVRLTFIFHCIQVEEEVPPPMPLEIEPMPLDPD